MGGQAILPLVKLSCFWARKARGLHNLPVKYWLMKSEPDTYSIDDLAKSKGPAMWEGCRNYVVRNFMRDEMKPGDKAFFYHSSCDPAGVVGTMEITGTAYPDPTQFDPKSDYYDAKSMKSDPRWLAVDVKLTEKFPRIVTLAEMRQTPSLEGMLLLRKGQRLSVMPVTEREWNIVHKMAHGK
jgi:predicted RNA-binding protein with PUA-like domain